MCEQTQEHIVERAWASEKDENRRCVRWNILQEGDEDGFGAYRVEKRAWKRLKWRKWSWLESLSSVGWESFWNPDGL